MRNPILLILLIIACAGSTCGFFLHADKNVQSEVAQEKSLLPTVLDSASAESRLNRQIANVLASPALRGSSYGIKIFNLVTRQDIYKYRASEPITPASTMKLLTSSAALSLYGPSYKIPTEILADNFSKGIVSGNLYIKGFGDPTFSIQDLDSLVQSLHNQGLRKVTGDIVGDGSYFDNIYERVQYSHDEQVVEPLPPVSALVLGRNTITIVATAGRPGEKARLQTVPIDPNIHFVNNSITSGSNARRTRSTQLHSIRKRKRSYTDYVSSKHVVFASYTNFTSDCTFVPVMNKRRVGRHKGTARSSLSFSVSHLKDGTSVISVTGRLPLGRTVSRQFELSDPAPAIAAILKARLESDGITVDGDVASDVAPDSARILAKKLTPLVNVLALLNKNSDNYAAEQVFKMIGARECPLGGLGSGLADTSAKYIRAFLAAANINYAGCAICDGSGLSHRALVTPDLIVGILDKMHSVDSLFHPFYNTLGIAGVDGTIHRRMIGTLADSNTHAKTGTLNRVSALAGYVNTRDGELWAFDITMNNINVNAARKIQDKLVEQLAEFSYKQE